MERKTKQGGETPQDLHSGDWKMVWAKAKVWENRARLHLRLRWPAPLPTLLPQASFPMLMTLKKKIATHTNEEISNNRQSHPWSSYFLIGQRSTGVWQCSVQEKMGWHHRENNFTSKNVEPVHASKCLHNTTVVFPPTLAQASVGHKIMLCGLFSLITD